MTIAADLSYTPSRCYIDASGNLNLNGASLLVPTGSTITIDSGATVANAAGETDTGAQSFSGGLTVTTANATITDVNIVLSTVTGTEIGTAVTQKLGFWGATPIVQPAGASQAAVVTTGSALTQYGYTQAQADSIVTLVNAIRTALVNAGIMKGAA